MTVKKRILISVVVGLTISGIGLGLVWLGGWGPCGPASVTAEIGGILSFYHVVLLCTWVPALESVVQSANSVVLNIVFMLLVPAVNWLLVVVGLLTLWGWFKDAGFRFSLLSLTVATILAGVLLMMNLHPPAWATGTRGAELIYGWPIRMLELPADPSELTAADWWEELSVPRLIANLLISAFLLAAAALSIERMQQKKAKGRAHSAD